MKYLKSDLKNISLSFTLSRTKSYFLHSKDHSLPPLLRELNTLSLLSLHWRHTQTQTQYLPIPLYESHLPTLSLFLLLFHKRTHSWVYTKRVENLWRNCVCLCHGVFMRVRTVISRTQTLKKITPKYLLMNIKFIWILGTF